MPSSPLDRVRRRHPGSSVAHILFYDLVVVSARLALKALFGAKYAGARNIPAHGPVLIIANHQSFLDPPLVSTPITQRNIDFIARQSLFKNPLFGRLITALNSVPISEQGGDAAAMKEALRRLAMDRAVLIFPEGTRSDDGAMRPFKRGVAVLLKRAKCPVVPAAVEGAHEVWPRGRKGPRLFSGPILVEFGEPIPHADLMAGGPDAAVQRLTQEVDRLRLGLRARLRERSGGRLPPPGPGDRPVTISNEAGEPGQDEPENLPLHGLGGR